MAASGSAGSGGPGSPSHAILLRCKDGGNRLFALGKWAAAADLYTEGIALCGGKLAPAAAAVASQLFTNRAQCRRLLGDFDAMESDAVRARELDMLNAKAHYLIGTAFLRREDYAVGVRHLEKGLDMARRTNRPAALLREFEVAIATGRADWHRSSTAEDRTSDSLLYSYCLTALQTHREARLRAVGGATTTASGSSSRPIPPVSTTPAAARRSVRYSVFVPAVAGEAPSEGLAPLPHLHPHLEADGDVEMASPILHVPAGAGAGGRRGGVMPSSSSSSSSSAAAAGGSGARASSGAFAPAAATASSAATVGAATIIADIDREHAEWTTALGAVFAERDAGRASDVEPPAEFVCPITFAVMLDPVITPSGHSYERAALATYFEKGGKTDPQTRRPLTLADLVPNLGLKGAIERWLAEHPLAHPLLPSTGSR